jgi:hypothetical protein
MLVANLADARSAAFDCLANLNFELKVEPSPNFSHTDKTPITSPAAALQGSVLGVHPAIILFKKALQFLGCTPEQLPPRAS